MNNETLIAAPQRVWLKNYYAVRALVSLVWVGLAFTLGQAQPSLSAALLVIYPAWDSLANYYDASRSGGLRVSPTQALNMVVSAFVAIAVASAIAMNDLHVAIGVIGVWASLAGILQLATAVRRWKSARAQWPMILSGAQSTLAGLSFLKIATNAATSPAARDVALYAAFGAFYFLISAISLMVAERRHSALAT
jgi:hypothetical protein